MWLAGRAQNHGTSTLNRPDTKPIWPIQRISSRGVRLQPHRLYGPHGGVPCMPSERRSSASRSFCLVGAFLALRMPSGVRSRSRRTSRRCLVLRHDKLAELPAPRRLQLHDACVSVRRLTEDGEPDVSLVQGLFQKAELEELVRICEARQGFQASLQRTSSGEFLRDRMRTSSSCPLLWPLFTPRERIQQLRMENEQMAEAVEVELAAVLSATNRCAQVIGVDEARVEPLQLIRYEPGQYYRPHMDTHEEPQRMSSYAGEQRSHTLLVFMTDIPEADGGGHLHFPKLGLRILPRAGDAVLWQNLDASGEPDPQMLHEGVAPNTCEKIAMNVWVAEKPFTLEAITAWCATHVVAFVSDGVDELAVAAGAARAGLVGKSPELLVLGLRSSQTLCRRVPLTIQKGDLLSRADDTVALCLAQMASAVLRRGALHGLQVVTDLPLRWTSSSQKSTGR
ncbi:P4HA1 [Symbiodinium natans]|uniref:P4HA1 protein n=1 Tax=Symbiodinium natans TaxID=878477 RepID=A0A812SWX1_9DINO|nr:P4HA1 [Symbiodinium natans]